MLICNRCGHAEARHFQTLDNVIDREVTCRDCESGALQWPRYDDGAIMWREVEIYERSLGCPLCGAAVVDTEAHVRWHEADR